MKRIASLVFWLICGGLSIYATYRQFKRYFENADAPMISFIPFNKSPTGDDIYPDLTFCFSEIPKGSGSLYDNAYLMQQHSLQKKEYQSLLIGGNSRGMGEGNGSMSLGLRLAQQGKCPGQRVRCQADRRGGKGWR